MLKENILSKSLTSKALDEDELILLRDTSVTDLADAAELPSPTAANLNQVYFVKGVHYRCEEVSAGVFEWVTYDSSGQSLNYQDISNKPSLNGIKINGALTSADYGLAKDTSGRTEVTDPTSEEILIGDDDKITYENLAAALNTLFDIANLPKYEKQFNPILYSNGTSVRWNITHRCKTSEPSVELYESDGTQKSQTTLKGLEILHGSSNRLSIIWDSGSNVAANTYYAVLIG